MIHALDQILFAVESSLSGVEGAQGVYRKPFALLDESDLDGVVIDEIEDETLEVVGFWPRTEHHQLRFDVIPVVAGARETVLAKLGALHQAVESRLCGSSDALRLNGLISFPMSRLSAVFFCDSETLGKPVCGWRLRFEIHYHTRSDLPGVIDRS